MNRKEKQRTAVSDNKLDDVSKRHTYTFQKQESKAPTYVAFRHRFLGCIGCLFLLQLR